MPVFSLTRDELRPLTPTTFAEAGLNERGDLQRLLREQVGAIAPGTLVIAEEFGDWEDSRRRIDLLGVDRDANLVVIELKRTEDGGHMELQAVRYAAMVSTMTFEQAVTTFSGYLARQNGSRDARQALLEHLGWDEPDENSFAQDVRIVLAAADFSRELTTAVLWLNEHGLDIRCVRMRPYKDGERLLIDVQQVIPLPEAEEYIVRIREKEQREQTARRERRDREKLFQEFWSQLLEYAATKTSLHTGRAASASHVQGQPADAPIPGLYLRYVLGRGHARVLLALYGERGKAAFDQLVARKSEIEAAFREPLEWERLDGQQLSRICFRLPSRGVRHRADWPNLREGLVDAMVRLEGALRPHLDRLTLA